MENHVKTLAILYIALSALGLLAAVIMLAVGGGIAGLVASSAQSDPDAAVAVPIIGVVFGFITILIAVISVPGIIAGIGLLQFKEWARILTIILSAVNILNVPFGTIVGVYGLWVLLSTQTVQLFAARRAAAAGAR